MTGDEKCFIYTIECGCSWTRKEDLKHFEGAGDNKIKDIRNK